jgi:hypothetical protein
MYLNNNHNSIQMEADIITITQIAVATGTLAATALSMLAGFALAHWQHHKEVTR